jgi:hypothetical protein
MASNLKTILQCTFLSALIIGSMAAVADENFPGHEPDRRILKTQEKVDSLFEKGDYERAMFIYRHELAPLGDKYAQYMIGFMYLTGKGVPQDAVQASAWYRLAAERGEDVFASARDELLMMFDQNSRPYSDSAYRELRLELSDVALLSGMIGADLEILRRSTQTRADRMGSSEELVGRRTRDYELVVERLQKRLDYLIDLSFSDDFEPDIEQKGIELLDDEVNREIALFESRR